MLCTGSEMGDAFKDKRKNCGLMKYIDIHELEHNSTEILPMIHKNMMFTKDRDSFFTLSKIPALEIWEICAI